MPSSSHSWVTRDSCGLPTKGICPYFQSDAIAINNLRKDRPIEARVCFVSHTTSDGPRTSTEWGTVFRVKYGIGIHMDTYQSSHTTRAHKGHIGDRPRFHHTKCKTFISPLWRLAHRPALPLLHSSLQRHSRRMATFVRLPLRKTTPPHS